MFFTLGGSLGMLPKLRCTRPLDDVVLTSCEQQTRNQESEAGPGQLRGRQLKKRSGFRPCCDVGAVAELQDCCDGLGVGFEI